MGQKQAENAETLSKENSQNSQNVQTNNKDDHMIEILKKENNVLKEQITSLNKKSSNYDTLLSMLEVLSMQRKKIESIFQGKYFY